MSKRNPKVGDVIFWQVPTFPFIAGGVVKRLTSEFPFVEGNVVFEQLAVMDADEAGPILAELNALKLRFDAGQKELIRCLAPEVVDVAPFAVEVDTLKRFIA